MYAHAHYLVVFPIKLENRRGDETRESDLDEKALIFKVRFSDRSSRGRSSGGHAGGL